MPSVISSSGPGRRYSPALLAVSTAAAEPSQVVLLSAVTVTRRHARALELARSGRKERQPTRARLRSAFSKPAHTSGTGCASTLADVV
jgi:hypothetical protein